ncbi:MAG: hypothetical protein HY314_12285 [Acidobacteria bacterium]|nr:hypothetical protein [Acidobacteriota bacterium]
MIENGSVDLAPKNWKTLRDQLKTHGRSKNKNRALPVHEPPSQVVKVKTLGILKRDDDEVIRDADTHCTATVKNVTNWANHQHSIIVGDFQTDVEQVIMDLFMEKVTDPSGQERYRPRLLGENYRNSITVGRDYLDYLRQKIDGLSQVVRQEFERQFYPAGPNERSLTAQLKDKVRDKIRAMQASPGNQTEEQEDYLRAMDHLLDVEVWYTLVQALQRTLADVQAIVEGLWDTIGDSAQGWCFTLDGARDALAKSYTQDESRRLAWTQMRLRAYLPTPGAEAEDALFAQIAGPHIDSFFDQASWHIAINSMQKGVERYELVFEYPGLGKKERDTVRMRTVLGQQLQVSQFNPDNAVVWAEAQLKQPLQSRTIWDIMNLDFQYDWLPKKGKMFETLSAADRASFQQQYVSEHINRLVNQSSPLWTLSGHNFQNKQVWGTWGSFVLAETPASIAEYFSADLQNRGEPLHPAPALPHEIRRATGYFRAPLTAWSYHATCYSHYLAYLQNPGVLVDIYPHEQNAHRIRQWIQKYIDPAMYELLDVTVTALLNDWTYNDSSDLAFRTPELEVFRLYALCYTMGLIPTRERASATAGKVYYLGHTELANVRDIDTLSFKILCTHFLDPTGVWHKNDVVYQELRKLWRDHEAQNVNATNIADWLVDMKQRADQLQFPVLPDHAPLIHREHLKKALQAVVYNYIEEVKAAKQLPQAVSAD